MARVRRQVSILGAGNSTPPVTSTDHVTSERPLPTLHCLFAVVAAQETVFVFLRPLSTPREKPTATSFNLRETDWFVPLEEKLGCWGSEGGAVLPGKSGPPPYPQRALCNSFLTLAALFEVMWASYLPPAMLPPTALVPYSRQMRASVSLGLCISPREGG